MTVSKYVESYNLTAPISSYSQPSYQQQGYQQQSYSNQYRRGLARRFPFFKGSNTFEDYYASSSNVSEVCTTQPTSCPICKESVDEKFEGICDYKAITESKFVESEQEFKFNVSKVIKSAEQLAEQYDFIINEKCLESCPQLDSTSGILLFIKNDAPKGSCLSFDENLLIVPSTYMNRFDSKALLKKHSCVQ